MDVGIEAIGGPAGLLEVSLENTFWIYRKLVCLSGNDIELVSVIGWFGNDGLLTRYFFLLFLQSQALFCTQIYLRNTLFNVFCIPVCF